jgi:pilus assembly protein Flp/PilA
MRRGVLPNVNHTGFKLWVSDGVSQRGTFRPHDKELVIMNKLFKLLSRDTRAVTALEYGIIAGVLGLVLIAIFQTFGSKLSGLFATIGSSI